MVSMKQIREQRLSEAHGVDLRELLQIALKRKWIVIATTGIVFGAVTLISFLIVPTYTAVGQILIEREPNILSFEDIFQIETFNDEYYQTQYKLLQSRALAGDTVDRMKLCERKEFTRAKNTSGPGRAKDLTKEPLPRRGAHR